MNLWHRIRRHLKVFGIALVFGLGIYTVIMVMHMIGHHLVGGKL